MATHSSNPLVFGGMLGSLINGLGSSSSSPTTNMLFGWGAVAGAVRGLITSSIKNKIEVDIMVLHIYVYTRWHRLVC